MKRKNIYSALVTLQFVGIFYIFASADMFARGTGLFITELLGIVLGVWAVLSMKVGNFNISPQIKNGSVMKTSGPYILIRHPMYLAIIITLTPLVYEYFSYTRLIVLIALIFLLLISRSLRTQI